jgi:hypothetical protein
LSIILIFLYVLFFSVIILKTELFKSDTLTKKYILSFFFIKIIAGFSYTYIFKNILNGQDIFAFFNDSQIAFSALKDNPLYYFQLVFGKNDFDPIPRQLFPYVDAMGFWFDQGNYVMVRINALFHLFSFGFFGVHVVFISFLSLIGIYNIYRFFEPSFPGDKVLLITFLFFTPSIVFWYSGLHKEAVVVFALGLILNSYQHIIKDQFKLIWLLAIIIGTLLLLMVRFYVFAVFLPGLVALFLSYRLKSIPKFYLFFSTYLLFLIISFIIDAMFPQISPFNEIVHRQAHFLSIKGNTSYAIPILDGSIIGTLKHIPNALLNALIHPVPKDCWTSSFLCFLAMIESYIILALLIFSAFKMKWSRLKNDAVINYCLFSSISLLIIIGLIVNNAGALVRYKSVVLPFLMVGIYMASVQKKEEVPM